MVTSLKFRHEKDSFQRELNEDIRKIKCSPNVFVFADKTSTKCQKTITRNFYMLMLLKLIKRQHPNRKPQLTCKQKAYLQSLKLATESNAFQEHLLS